MSKAPEQMLSELMSIWLSIRTKTIQSSFPRTSQVRTVLLFSECGLMKTLVQPQGY